jgi:type IV pilus assembly protein PilB
MDQRPYILELVPPGHPMTATARAASAATAAAELRQVAAAVAAGHVDWRDIAEWVAAAYNIGAIDQLPAAGPPPAAHHVPAATALAAAGIQVLRMDGRRWQVAVGHPDDLEHLPGFERSYGLQLTPVWLPPPLADIMAAEPVSRRGAPATQVAEAGAAAWSVDTGRAAAHGEPTGRPSQPAAAVAATQAPTPNEPWWQWVAATSQAGASDWHLETTAGGARVLWRRNGRIEMLGHMNRPTAQRWVNQLKNVCALPVDRVPRAADAHLAAPAGSGLPDVRVSLIPGLFGPNLVLRLLPAALPAADPVALGMPPPLVAAVRAFLQRDDGLLLIGGPTGAGKTTTLHTCVQWLDCARRKVLAIEDPIERTLPGVQQVPVDPRLRLDFHGALRAFLRQAPNVIIVGEIRDAETADAVARACLAGHLILATIHADSPPGIDVRLIDLGWDPSLLQRIPRLTFTQRLVAKPCDSCLGGGCFKCGDSGVSGRRPRFTQATQAVTG